MRGTESINVQKLKIRRITPACAGNRAAGLFISAKAEDHPRVCGEQQCFSLAQIGMKGSPPRVRGTVYLPPIPADQLGITPACAGNRWKLEKNTEQTRDHPRVCGEQAIKAASEASMAGSPPRVRGTV